MITLARQLIEAQKEKDDIKAYNDLLCIGRIMQRYHSTLEYDPNYAIQLDQQIRIDYPIIYKLCDLPSNGTPQKNAQNAKKLPNELIALDTDQYGILISVLLKKNVIKTLEDILE